MTKFFTWLDRRNDWGIFLLRLFIGFRLVYGVLDNILSWEHLLRFRDFLQQFHFPFPLISAITSVYIQLLAGLMLIIGWGTRYAALLVIINFLIALIMVHRNQSIEAMTPALAILFSAILFLFAGAGRISIDRK
jgi:putative oxidoreductase